MNREKFRGGECEDKCEDRVSGRTARRMEAVPFDLHQKTPTSERPSLWEKMEAADPEPWGYTSIKMVRSGIEFISDEQLASLSSSAREIVLRAREKMGLKED